MPDQAGRGVSSKEKSEAWRWTRRGSHGQHVSFPLGLASVPSTGNGTEWGWGGGIGAWVTGEMAKICTARVGKNREASGTLVSPGCSCHLHPESPALVVLCGEPVTACCPLLDSWLSFQLRWVSRQRRPRCSSRKGPQTPSRWHSPPQRKTRSPTPTERTTVQPRPPPTMYVVTSTRYSRSAPCGRPRRLGK